MEQLDFMGLVRRMRTAQKMYARIRSKEHLEKSKVLESQVDDRIDEAIHDILTAIRAED